MAQVAVRVERRVFGEPRASVQAPLAHIQLFDDSLTAEQLIRRTVEEQLRTFAALDDLDVGSVHRRIALWFHERPGAVPPAPESVRLASEPIDGVRPDPAIEVEHACHAFEAGAFRLFIDGLQIERLDQCVNLTPQSRVTFLRLMPLVGG